MSEAFRAGGSVNIEYLGSKPEAPKVEPKKVEEKIIVLEKPEPKSPFKKK